MKAHKAAFLLFLLFALLMFCIVKGLGETPRRYQRRVQRHLSRASYRLAKMDTLSAATGPEALYVLRGEIDIDMAVQMFHQYQRNQMDKPLVDAALKQLDRDMEDYPPQEAKR